MKFAVLFAAAVVLTPMSATATSVFDDSRFSHATLNLTPGLNQDAPWARLIASQAEWEAFYAEILPRQPGDAAQAPPEIDFTRHQVIAGGIGAQPSGGYRLVVERVDERTDAVNVGILVVAPGPDCFVTQAITYPETVFVLARSSKPLQFSIAQVTQDCGR